MIASVKNRQEMASRLEHFMTSSYDELKEELRLERNHSLLKTYLIEAHSATTATHDQLFQIISKAFVQSGRKKSPTALVVAETEEADLFTVAGNTRTGILSLFIDTTDPRFWMVHAISKSDTSDHAINGILEGSSALDSAWMPIELLKDFMTLGESRGLGLDFDRRFIDHVPKRRSSSEPLGARQAGVEREKNPVDLGDHLEYAKLQLWGSGADRILAALAGANLNHSTTLSKVRLRNENEEDVEQFALTDVKFDGKVTGRGSSFDTYNNVVLSVRNKYSTVIRDTEDIHQLRWEDGPAPIRKGRPFILNLGESGVSNLEHFCARVFSGTDPFRLIALPVRRNANFYTASAIDLHVNQKIDFEITRKFMIAYLPAHACGNTLLRLYTNLQHYFSSDVKAVDGSGKSIFNFQS
jgi:hypothetical protein